MQQQSPLLMNPYMFPEYSIAVDRVRSDCRVGVLTDGPQIVGFFPFQNLYDRLGVGVPIGHGYNDWHGLIHVPGLEWSAGELLKACKLAVWRFDHLAEGQHLFSGFAADTAVAPLVDFSAGFDAYYSELKTRSAKFCRDLERRSRRLEETLGKVHLEVGSKSRADLRMLMRWKAEQAHRNGYPDPFAASWLVKIFDYLLINCTDTFGGLLSVLYAGDTPVAASFDLRGGARLEGWAAAYDLKLANRGPGMIQHVRLAERVAELGVSQLNLGDGNHRYKELLINSGQTYAKGVAARSLLRATADKWLKNAEAWAVPRIKRHRALYKAAVNVARYGRA